MLGVHRAEALPIGCHGCKWWGAGWWKIAQGCLCFNISPPCGRWGKGNLLNHRRCRYVVLFIKHWQISRELNLSCPSGSHFSPPGLSCTGCCMWWALGAAWRIGAQNSPGADSSRMQCVMVLTAALNWRSKPPNRCLCCTCFLPKSGADRVQCFLSHRLRNVH